MKSSSVSKCCGAELLLYSDDEGPSFYYCSECGDGCDHKSTQQSGKDSQEITANHQITDSINSSLAEHNKQLNFMSDNETIKELQDLIQDCRSCPGDESYRLHLADYILEKWEEL